MQTFLPFEDFERSASVLDSKRLGKQRVEVLQILRALRSPVERGWKLHPAVLMWRGSESFLSAYGIAICQEWINRGYQDTCFDKILEEATSFEDPPKLPWWRGDERFHLHHRQMLVFKEPAHYIQHFEPEAITSPAFYLWPDPTKPGHFKQGLKHYWPVHKILERKS